MTELEKYKIKYSEFVGLLADLHNFHVSFGKEPNWRNGIGLRRIIRKIRVLQKELWDASQLATKEAKTNTSDRLKRLREARAYRKLHPQKAGRKPKEK